MTTDFRAPITKRQAMRVATTLIGATAFAAALAPAATAEAAARPAGPRQPIGERPGRTARPMTVRAGAGATPALGGHRYRPANIAPSGSHYALGIFVSPLVESFHVCGWHPTNTPGDNTWRCTPTRDNPNWPDSQYYDGNVGGNTDKWSWAKGTIDVYWNKGGRGSWDTCNTNGDYYGYFASQHEVVLNSAQGGGIGFGVPEC
jgi:hypothetical protein